MDVAKSSRRHGDAPDTNGFGNTIELHLVGNGALLEGAQKMLRLGALKNFIRHHQVVALRFFDQPRGEVHDGTEKIQAVVRIHGEARAGVQRALEAQPDFFGVRPRQLRVHLLRGIQRLAQITEYCHHRVADGFHHAAVVRGDDIVQNFEMVAHQRIRRCVAHGGIQRG